MTYKALSDSVCAVNPMENYMEPNFVNQMVDNLARQVAEKALQLAQAQAVINSKDAQIEELNKRIADMNKETIENVETKSRRKN